MQAPLIVSHAVLPRPIQAPGLLPEHSLPEDQTMNVPVDQHAKAPLECETPLLYHCRCNH